MRLSINIDHIATLRNARGGTEPDPITAAHIVERASADGIVCHLREDRRHIRDDDVKRLREEISVKLDLEMAATPEIVALALKIKPDLVTLVPEKRKELTTEGGLNVVRLQASLKKVVDRFHDRGIPVSLFVDPKREQLDASRVIGAEMIEIHTGEYAEARSASSRKNRLNQIQQIAMYGKTIGLGVNAGHGLDYENIAPIAATREIEEVSIGHAIIVRAVFVGLEKAVREMVEMVRRGQADER
ncbi:MAG: pyridoxine 5'-phosphate synthase [Ignavibacteria bacterium]|nr:pyridoxine 5'-phosphate synthase [Ignavibacteria bacterium]MBI3765882.1 pyridoxine 5'-phosphate synthase [Ignavibacteriales bacterium]